MQRGTTQTLNLTGDGYQAGETVRITGPFDPALVLADNRGHVTFQRQLAPDPGAYSVSAMGQTSGVVQTAPFNVTSIDLSSAGLPAGTAGPLLVNAHGWQPYEPVALTLSPAGLIPDAVLTADRDGNVVNWSRALLTTAATGVYTLTLSGEGSGMRMSVPFHMLQLGVTPTLIDAGQHPVLGIRGYGFTPNGDVSVRGGPFGTFIERADGSGLLVAPEVVNSGRFGSYTLIAYDYGSGASISTRLDVLGAEASNTYAGGQANLGGGGFVPNEVVQLHTTPAGVVEDFSVTADASGNLPGSNFVLSAQAPAGEYALMLKGLTSGRQAQASALVLTSGGLAVTPSSSAPGSYPLLALSAQGFQPGEIVDITGDAFGEIEVLADGSGAAHAEMRVTRGDANRFKSRRAA